MGRGNAGERGGTLPAISERGYEYVTEDFVLVADGALHLLPSGSGLVWDARGAVYAFVFGAAKCMDLHPDALPVEGCEHQVTVERYVALAADRAHDMRRMSFFGTSEDGSSTVAHLDSAHVFEVSPAPEGWTYRLHWPALDAGSVVTVTEEGVFPSDGLPAPDRPLARALAYLLIQILPFGRT